MRRGLSRVAIAAALLATPAPRVLPAQQLEARVEAQWTKEPVWYLGTGLTWRAGNYARLSALGAYAADAERGRALRGDLVARVTLDPFRRRRVGFSMGGGLTVARRARLLAVAELEGPLWGRFSPAVQVGLGDGYRASLIIRQGRAARR